MSAVSASQASEIVGLLLMVLLVPMAIALSRRLARLPGDRWFMAGFLCMASVQAFSVAERYLLGNPVLPVKQFAVAVAGWLFAIGLWQLALAVRRREVL